jgi:hypothetical protein
MTHVYSRYPDYVGTAVVGWTRVGVYTERWERLFAGTGAYRNFVWRKLKYMLPDDVVTGYKVPSYEETTCDGIMVQKGSSMPSFAWGVALLEDAVLFTLDPVGYRGTDESFADQVVDGESTFEVSSVQKNLDSLKGGLAFYVVQLRKVSLLVEV